MPFAENLAHYEAAATSPFIGSIRIKIATGSADDRAVMPVSGR
jgi:hypothetical protein